MPIFNYQLSLSFMKLSLAKKSSCDFRTIDEHPAHRTHPTPIPHNATMVSSIIGFPFLGKFRNSFDTDRQKR